MMTWKTWVAAALLSTITAASASAQEPAAFQAQYPNRDVLNGGALTPAGRMGLEAVGGAVPSANVTVQPLSAPEPSRATRPRHHHRRN